MFPRVRIFAVFALVVCPVALHAAEAMKFEIVVGQGKEGPQVTAVKEPLDRFLGDGPIRVALPRAVAGELAQHPFLDFEPVSASVARGDQFGDQARQRRLRHCAHPPLPGR